VNFKILTAVAWEITVFWAVTMCSFTDLK